MGESKLKKMSLDLLFDILGSVVYAVGLHCFTVPNRIAPGGVSGLSTILNYLWGAPIGLTSFLINVPLLLLAFRFLGRAFALRTLRTVVVMSVLLDSVAPFLPAYTGNPILAALFGGACMGAGLALVFMRGSTTGGSDIVSYLVQLKYPYLPIGRLILLINVAVLLLAALAYQNIETLLYGMIAIFTSSQVIDNLIYGMDSGRLLIVMSERPKEIADEIIARVGRGVTFLNGEGAYSGLSRKVILCAVRNQQYFRIKKIVTEIDPEAFLIVTEANEILGYGFNPLNRRK